MKIGEISKEQRQYAVLGLLVVGIVIYALYAFVLSPFVEGWKETKAEYDELDEKLSDAHQKVNRMSQLMMELDGSFTNLMSQADLHIPPPDTALSWVTSRIYAHARTLGIDIESISENSSNPPWLNVPGSEREFQIYSVRVTTQCGFNDLRAFVERFVEKNPLVAVSGVKIESNDFQNPEQHRVQLFLEWPWWTSSEGSEIIRSSLDLNNDEEPASS